MRLALLIVPLLLAVPALAQAPPPPSATPSQIFVGQLAQALAIAQDELAAKSKQVSDLTKERDDLKAKTTQEVK